MSNRKINFVKQGSIEDLKIQLSQKDKIVRMNAKRCWTAAKYGAKINILSAKNSMYKQLFDLLIKKSSSATMEELIEKFK